MPKLVSSSYIEGDFSGWDDNMIFKLQNGQVWIQDEYKYSYSYSYCPQARINKKGNDYYLNVDGMSDFIKVRQVVDYIESSIDGDFEGWEGETIFKLQNGQVWKQNEYAYMYSYSYSPTVLIYNTGFGIRMKVDSVDETIEVTRLK